MVHPIEKLFYGCSFDGMWQKLWHPKIPELPDVPEIMALRDRQIPLEFISELFLPRMSLPVSVGTVFPVWSLSDAVHIA